MLLGTVQLRADVTGSIIGYVRDSSGAVLPNATLTVIQTSTGYTRTATTDGSGAYSILALPPGNYRLTASMAGFENGVVENINLNVNDALKFDFALQGREREPDRFCRREHGAGRYRDYVAGYYHHVGNDSGHAP